MACKKRLESLGAMDLQRNLSRNLSDLESDFDSFIPGWRNIIDIKRGEICP